MSKPFKPIGYHGASLNTFFNFTGSLSAITTLGRKYSLPLLQKTPMIGSVICIATIAVGIIRAGHSIIEMRSANQSIQGVDEFQGRLFTFKKMVLTANIYRGIFEVAGFGLVFLIADLAYTLLFKGPSAIENAADFDKKPTPRVLTPQIDGEDEGDEEPIHHEDSPIGSPSEFDRPHRGDHSPSSRTTGSVATGLSLNIPPSDLSSDSSMNLIAPPGSTPKRSNNDKTSEFNRPNRENDSQSSNGRVVATGSRVNIPTQDGNAYDLYFLNDDITQKSSMQLIQNSK